MARGRLRTTPLWDAAVGFSVLGLVSIGIYLLLWLIDFGSADSNPLALFREPGAADTLTSFSEVTVGVLGVAITVVAIIVELAANRYTPRITELFVRDPINIAAMSSFVVVSAVVLWTNMSLYGPHYPTAMAIVATALMSASLLAILPYFAYVFDFLSPTNVILRIQHAAGDRMSALARRGSGLGGTQAELATSVEQLGDIALNSVDNKDKPLAFATVGALAELARQAIAEKEELPDDWFDTAPLVRNDPDFIALHPDMVRALTDRRTWVEMKVMRQYQSVFGDALNRMRDVNHLIAIHTRRIASTALKHRDEHAQLLAIRFMNTYLRAALNARDVRTAYNLLNEYRLLAERALAEDRPELVMELADRIKGYGQLAFAMQLGFILESAAYDLCTLLEQASTLGREVQHPLLELFLDVDREPEGGKKAQEASLRGVRKAQVKLATHYLVRGETEPARRIYEDMRAEKAARLRSIRAELLAVVDAEFWEVSDRGINFDWLPPERRAQLDTFFSWFEGI